MQAAAETTAKAAPPRRGRPKGSKNKPKTAEASAAPRRRRRDPEFRPLDPTQLIAHVDNKDPNRHYVLVNANDQMAMFNYRAAGYVAEDQRPDGPRLAIGDTVKDGEEMVSMGNVLMSVSKEQHERIIRRGIGGDTGLDLADEREKRMLKKSGMYEKDPMRGRHGGARVVDYNEDED